MAHILNGACGLQLAKILTGNSLINFLVYQWRKRASEKLNDDICAVECRSHWSCMAKVQLVWLRNWISNLTNLNLKIKTKALRNIFSNNYCFGGTTYPLTVRYEWYTTVYIYFLLFKNYKCDSQYVSVRQFWPDRVHTTCWRQVWNLSADAHSSKHIVFLYD